MTAYLMNKQNEQDTEGGGGVLFWKRGFKPHCQPE